MTNPFEDDDGSCVVLGNDEEQHSLWPDFLPPPAGWSRRHGPDSRASCLEFVERNWTDLRPLSVRDT